MHSCMKYWSISRGHWSSNSIPRYKTPLLLNLHPHLLNCVILTNVLRGTCRYIRFHFTELFCKRKYILRCVSKWSEFSQLWTRSCCILCYYYCLPVATYAIEINDDDDIMCTFLENKYWLHQKYEHTIHLLS